MKRQSKLLFITIATSLLLTSACSSIKQELGVARNSPDEFTVVKRAPLTLPPEYNLMPPMDKDEINPNSDNSMKSANETAKEAVFGTNPVKAEVKAATSDTTFLTKLKVDSAQPNIRKLIEEDNGYISIKNLSLVDKLTSSDEETSTPDKVPSSVVDAAAENKRIKENLKAKKPINTGTVPVIEKKLSTIDKIF